MIITYAKQRKDKVEKEYKLEKRSKKNFLYYLCFNLLKKWYFNLLIAAIIIANAVI